MCVCLGESACGVCTVRVSGESAPLHVSEADGKGKERPKGEK